MQKIGFKKGIVLIFVFSFMIVIALFSNNFTSIVKDDDDVTLSDFFTVAEDRAYSYEGTSEYSHMLMLQDVTNKDSFKQFTYKGYMTEGIGPIDLEGKERKFFISYNVYDDKVIREDENGSRVVLKTPLKEGTSWNTVVQIKNQEYNATSIISELSQDGDSIVRCVVETEVQLGSKFNNAFYLEKSVYDLGEGLVYFEKPIYLADGTSRSFNYSLMNTIEKEKFLEFIDGLKKASNN